MSTISPVLLHDQVARQAARTPQAAAVLDGGLVHSYAQLDARANRLANHLRDLGAGPEVPVAVCLERGFDLVVALLGVWRSGSAYVPIDPAYPAARREWILQDTAAKVVLDADTDWTALERCPDSDPRVRIEPDAAAYIVYTSGSTGRPKGVVVTHEGIGNRVGWTVRRHGLGPADRVLQKTSIGFDAACWEFFGPLSSGGCVVLAPRGAERDPAALARAVRDERITVLQGVPSVYRLLAEEPAWRECSSLRLVFSAGEALHAELCQRLLAGHDFALWNTYGPTECSIDATAHRLDPAQLTGPVPIGRPIENLYVVVLDPAGEPVPVGMAGELYLGGRGLGRGYLNQPALTADRFVPDEFGEPGSRLYRTGDRARWRADQSLEYLGRVDDQLKVNGVRIEPGEIEAVLTGHPQVRGAAVVGLKDESGATRLAAYVRTAEPVPPGQLREYLVGRLPEAVIPAVFRSVERFPLTPNGKVDRAALAAIVEPAEQGGFVEPSTPEERFVAEAWQDLLGIERVGAHDDFFQLGGSSLVLARLAGRLIEGGRAAIEPRKLFTATTVRAQAALLAESAGAGDGGEGAAAAIPLLPRGRGLPLSFGQQRLWFLDQMHPGSREWVAPLFLRLPADLDVLTVQRALDALEVRHEALRTHYTTVEGQPLQYPGAPGPVELRVVDLPASNAEQVDDRLAKLFGEQFDGGFDLEHGPLWRAMLVRIPGQPHVLLITLHHIASDGWSTVVLSRDLRELAAAEVAGRVPQLPELPVQYADFASWQRAQLTDQVRTGELEYWRKALADLPRLELPADRVRPAERDPAGSGVRVELPAELAGALADLGRGCAATPFMTLLAGFAATLARYTGQWDVPVGTPVAGRGRPEVGDVAGFFLNSLVLRCGLAPELSFTEAVRRVRSSAVSAFEHQALPFELLVDELVPERDLSRTPLYQVAFDLQDEGATSVTAEDDTAMEAFQRAWKVAKTDLTLFMWRRADGSLAAAFEYATTVFDRDTVQRLADHFVRLLTAAVADPDTALADLEYLADAERGQLVAGWNETAADFPAGTVLDRFEAQVAATPDAVALEAGERTYSYAELDAQAARTANLLHNSGLRAGAVVGVLLDRGVDLLATLLGVWKLGGAYVPLDPSYPAERIAAMLEDAGASAAVSTAAYAERLTVPTLMVDKHAQMIGSTSVRALPRTTDPDELAYVIFTSGSTGRPKGVQVTHRGLANHVGWAAAELASRGTGGAPLFSSVAFDLVVPNLWAPLVVGQRVHVIAPDLDLARLGSALSAAGPFSFIKLTPGHLQILGEQLADEAAADLAGVIVVAGEALPGSLANRWLDLLGPGRLINEYGPTEASVGTCIFPIRDRQPEGTVPIGRPLPNMTMYVLDSALRPVPVGVTGELYVGGTGVARGYAGRPELTAERFLPDPFGAGGRLYRTGDLVRRLASGDVAFLGRIDDQVKIRGYRIEPGEIRAVLAAHPGVRDAAILADQHHLTAFYVPDQDGAAVEGLAEYCATRLPDYMVPAAFVLLDRIPLNANGKLDRSALPGPPESGAGAQGQLAPRTVVEERIAEVWTELLGRPVGVLDDFFQLGGHSLLAIRLIARLQEEFDLDLPMRLIFERPSVAGLAEAVEAEIRAEIAALPEEQLRRETAADSTADTAPKEPGA
ncbi:non-ribosomal peptide synthetase [Actinospica robiniae]|uniref:non-ribosomal peptide synthetase n=1 Tax=Actinospica robiniae TaxID=304901 RepID=UPI00041E415F|nr:non-ribosomal peptide synthetase [Actinospica robiniae]